MVEYLWKIMFIFPERKLYPQRIHVVLNASIGCFAKNVEQGPNFKEEKQVFKTEYSFRGINAR